MASELDKDVVEAVARAMMTPQIGHVSGYWCLQAERAILAYRSAMDEKRRTPEEVAHGVFHKVLIAKSNQEIFYLITAAIKADRGEKP